MENLGAASDAHLQEVRASSACCSTSIIRFSKNVCKRVVTFNLPFAAEERFIISPVRSLREAHHRFERWGLHIGDTIVQIVEGPHIGYTIVRTVEDFALGGYGDGEDCTVEDPASPSRESRFRKRYIPSSCLKLACQNGDNRRPFHVCILCCSSLRCFRMEAAEGAEEAGLGSVVAIATRKKCDGVYSCADSKINPSYGVEHRRATSGRPSRRASQCAHSHSLLQVINAPHFLLLELRASHSLSQAIYAPEFWLPSIAFTSTICSIAELSWTLARSRLTAICVTFISTHSKHSEENWYDWRVQATFLIAWMLQESEGTLHKQLPWVLNCSKAWVQHLQLFVCPYIHTFEVCHSGKAGRINGVIHECLYATGLWPTLHKPFSISILSTPSVPPRFAKKGWIYFACILRWQICHFRISHFGMSHVLCSWYQILDSFT